MPVDCPGMPTRRSLAHPEFKTRYRVANRADYVEAVINCNILIWLTELGQPESYAIGT